MAGENMTGKIFSDSTNIYQDQAKVLFDYYKKAAEKIVGEEMVLEQKIDASENEKRLSQKLKKTGKVLMIVFGILFGTSLISEIVVNLAVNEIPSAFSALYLFTITAFIFLIVGIVKFVNGNKGIKNADGNILAFTEAKNDIRREYKVSKMGVVYVPIASKVPFEEKSFVVDHTGTMQNTDFSLSILHKPQEFQTSLSELEGKIEKVPVVENNENAEEIDTSEYSKSVQNVVLHDYMGGLDREVRNISYLLNDNDTISVSLPVIPPESEHDKFLSEYATTETGDKPIVKVFNVDNFSNKLESFSRLNDMKKELEKRSNEDNVTYLKKLMKRLGESVTLLSKIKINSTSRLTNYTNMIFSCVLKSAFNQYSPTLEAEEIARIREASFDFQDSVDDYKPFALKQSSRVKYDLMSGSWIAEDNSRTNMPFGMNQIQEEVLMPVINNLMNETRVERLKIYNGIKDQKLHYLNEWNKDVEDAFRDNRKAGQDLIAQITEAYAEYNSAYQTYMSYKNTQDALKKSGNLNDAEVQENENVAEQIAGFEMQAEQCAKTSDEFQDYMDRLQDDIQQKSAQFEHIEYYEASLRDAQSRDFARSQDMNVLQNLSERQKRLVPISTYNAVYAKLPPEPSTEEKLTEDFDIDLKKKSEEILLEIENKENEVPPEDETPPQDDVPPQDDETSPSDETPQDDVPPSDETTPEDDEADEDDGENEYSDDDDYDDDDYDGEDEV